MTTYAQMARDLRAEAARGYAAFDRYADQGKDLAATRALREARKADAQAAVYEKLAEGTH